MRVISGKARGRRLKRVPGDSTRPVRDIVKESLFNILGQWVRGSRWLDLFAGTGAIGIEALSRGADSVVFLDRSRAAVQTIYDNLAATGLEEGATVHRIDSFDYLTRGPGDTEPFELVYIAPPQYKGLWRKALEAIDERIEWLHPDGMVVVQIHPREYEDVPLRHFTVVDEREYGTTRLVFYERKSEVE